jgi:perosamine synthetase
LNKLAINGGKLVRTEPMPARKLFQQEEKQAVMDLFDKAMREGHGVFGYNGLHEDNYCKEFAEFLGGGFADGVNSGTNAVYIALRALELEPGSEVVVPAISDPGGVMPVALCNCIPVAADTVENYYNIGSDQIEEKLTNKTSAIIVAHIAGIPADMDPIMKLADSKGIPVIEDCAQSHGAKYKGRTVGTIGAISSFSLMFGKNHATGGQGGMVFTKDRDLYWKVRQHADRGKPFGIENSPNGNIVCDLNCNMDELHACIGRVQLQKLPDINLRRQKLAKLIAERCRQELRSIRLKEESDNCEGVYWFLFFKCDESKLSVSKDDFARAVAAEGLPVNNSYMHVPMRMEWAERFHAFGQNSKLPWSLGRKQSVELSNIDKVDSMFFNCGLHEDWTQKEVDDLITALKKVESAYLNPDLRRVN